MPIRLSTWHVLTGCAGGATDISVPAVDGFDLIVGADFGGDFDYECPQSVLQGSCMIEGTLEVCEGRTAAKLVEAKGCLCWTMLRGVGSSAGWQGAEREHRFCRCGGERKAATNIMCTVGVVVNVVTSSFDHMDCFEGCAEKQSSM